MTNSNLDWAVPVMRAGYAGRGTNYVIISVLSLIAIWRGDTPGGTSEALKAVETEPWGVAVLSLTALGLLAYALWRMASGFWDLEDYGKSAKGIIARSGQIVSGLVHFGLAVGVVTIVFAAGASQGDQSVIAKGTAWVMSMPFGRILVGLAGAVMIGAGAYYIRKGLTHKYLEQLRANEITFRLRPALTAGLVAQGVTIGVIGFLFLLAAWQANPNEAGGLGEAFDWLREQPFGTYLVTALAAGLLAFALLCFVNAAYRIVPRLNDDGIETLDARIKAVARKATH
ncbi:MAG: DUF1206 domain-containing protein [Rhodobacterales bacterium]|nr:DUF1206 domain-containing protein [Rhodobacterales bacterium]